MERIKNFIYDKSDLFVALLIIGIAALVIWFGIHQIMAPVREQAEANAQNLQESVQDDSSSRSSVSTTPSSTSEGAQSSNGALATEDVKIIILPEESTDDIAEKLLVSDVITDKDEFIDQLDQMELTEEIKEGTFTIPQGSTVEEICEIITETNEDSENISD